MNRFSCRWAVLLLLALPEGALPITIAASTEDSAAVVRQRQSGEGVYLRACAACHQQAGGGLPGLFPPLAGNDALSAPRPDRLIRILLGGLTGPITVNGQRFRTTAPFMPAQGAVLTDAEIADVLTWLRSSLGNAAGSVAAEDVAAVRTKEAGRRESWTEKELASIPDR